MHFPYFCIQMKNYNHLFIGNAESTCKDLNITHMPVRLEQGGLFLCQRGHTDIVIDLKQYHITAGDIVIAFPYTVVQTIGYSEDFDGNTLGADVSFFASIQIPDKSSYYLYIMENPCISLLEEEWNKIVSLHDRLLSEHADEEHPLRREIDECMMKIITYEIIAIYLKRKPLTQQPRSRNEKIFQEFIFSLFNNYHIHRSLEFYAAEQSITPRHLSTIVKQMSGQTAGEWIISCTIMNIKSKLQNKDMSVKEISDEMNFPNPSFFSQYFKKYAGVTPTEYRKSIF